MLTNPIATTVGDLCLQAIKDCGALGVGQTPLSEDITEAQVRMQWLLQQWERARWLIYHLVTYTVVSDGRITPYLVGPGSPDINTDVPAGNFNDNFNNTFGGGNFGFTTTRPNRIESAFFQQFQTGPQGPIRYPLRLLESMEDYVKIALPNLTTFSLVAFYDPAWPIGKLYVYPWPLGSIYGLGIVCREQLPQGFPSLATVITLPFEYYLAIVSNTAILLRPKYGIGTFPGDQLPMIAKNSLNVLRKGNTAIANLTMPPELGRNGLYNIYSDQTY